MNFLWLLCLVSMLAALLVFGLFIAIAKVADRYDGEEGEIE